MKKTILGITFSSLIVLNTLGQTPPSPTPYGYGTFLAFDPNTFQPISFLSCPAYFPGSDAIYAFASWDTSVGTYQGDGFYYGIQSDLNSMANFTNFIENPFQGADRQPYGPDPSSPIPTPAVGNDGSTYLVDQSGTLYAFDLHGNPKWTCFVMDINDDGCKVGASPSIGPDGNIYIATDDGNTSGIFYCIDPDLGLPKWKLAFDVGDQLRDMDASPLCTPMGIFDVDEGTNASGASPVFLHFITYYGQEYSTLSVGSLTAPSVSPAITSDESLWIGTGDGNLLQVSPFSHQILNTITVNRSSPVSGSPVVGPDNNIYIGTADGNFFAVSLHTSQVIAEINLGANIYLSTAAIGSDAEAYVATTSEVFNLGLPGPDFSPTSSGSLFAMHLVPNTGGGLPFQFVVDWEKDVPPGTAIGGGFVGSPLVAQVGSSHSNVVYDANVNGKVYAFDAKAGPSTNTWSTFQGNNQRQGNWSNQCIPPPQVWSVQFGQAPLLNQTGKAAYGNSSTDYWNGAVIQYNSNPNPQWFYNLANSDGSPSLVTVTPASGANFNGLNVVPAQQPFNDYLMENIMTAQSSSFTLNITGLPTQGFNGNPAKYDVYVYAYGGQTQSGGQAYNSRILINPPGTDPLTGTTVSQLTTSNTPPPDLTHFHERFEYVVFRDVPVTLSDNPQIQITVTNDPNNAISFPLINGIQIVAKQSSFPSPPCVSAGIDHSLAVKLDGSVWAWGANDYGDLGNGSTTQSLIPVQVPTLSGCLAVSCNGNTSYALRSDGTVWSWGLGGQGQLGTGGTPMSVTRPVLVKNLNNVVAIAAGLRSAYALRCDGTVWSWGDNTYGQLGDGTTYMRPAPVQVQNLTGITAISAGSPEAAFALKLDGTVWGWGNGRDGELGNGLNTYSEIPVQVSISNVVAIASQFLHAYALTADGNEWAWGSNLNGQLGDGTQYTRTRPVPVKGLPPNSILAIYAGFESGYALDVNGTLWGWGGNTYGELGNGTTTASLTPISTTLLPTTTAVSADTCVLAVRTYLTLEGWGQDSTGQLGDGSTTDHHVPEIINFSFQ